MSLSRIPATVNTPPMIAHKLVKKFTTKTTFSKFWETETEICLQTDTQHCFSKLIAYVIVRNNLNSITRDFDVILEHHGTLVSYPLYSIKRMPTCRLSVAFHLITERQVVDSMTNIEVC